MNTPTPWGVAQHIEHVADGIDIVSTASHGGIMLDPSRVAAMPAYMSNASHAGPSAYEEDCDWCMPVLIFENEFRAYYTRTKRPDIGAVFTSAKASLRNWRPAIYEQFYGVALKPEESYSNSRQAPIGSSFTNKIRTGRRCLDAEKAPSRTTAVLKPPPPSSTFSTCCPLHISRRGHPLTLRKEITVHLIPEALRARMLANDRNLPNDDDPFPVVKLFTPGGGATWLLTEIDTDNPDPLSGSVTPAKASRNSVICAYRKSRRSEAARSPGRIRSVLEPAIPTLGLRRSRTANRLYSSRCSTAPGHQRPLNTD